MASDRAALIIDESNLEMALVAASLPLPARIMVWGLGALDNRPDNPIDDLKSLVSNIMKDVGAEGLFAREEEFPDNLDAADLGGQIAEYVAWSCLLRADAFEAWLRHHREMAPVVDALINAAGGDEIFGECLVSADLELDLGRSPIFAEDISDAIWAGLVQAGESPVIFVEATKTSGGGLDGFAITTSQLLELVNTRSAIAPLLLALITRGYTDPYRDLILSARDKLFSDVEAAMTEFGVADAGGFRRMDPTQRLAMFLGHLARAQAIRSHVAAKEMSISEIEEFEDLLSRPIKLAEDGITFVLQGDEGELLRDQPDGFVGQPQGRQIFPQEMIEEIEELGDAPAGKVLGAMGIALPDDMQDVSFSEFQDRLRITLSRVRRRDADEYLASLGWELDIAGFDGDEVVVHLEFLGFLYDRPVYVYAAGTPPLSWDDPALKWSFDDLEGQVGERPILLAIFPLFQVQRDGTSNRLKRIVIQGGWAYDEGWKPFVLSRQGAGALENGNCILGSDRLPKAFFARHGQGKEGLEALKSLVKMRHAALPAEIRSMMPDPSASKFTYLGSTSGWLSLVDEEKTDRLRGLFG